MRTNYHKGRDKEYRTIYKLRRDGWLCQRTAGSHSPFDIIAINIKDKIIKLVQCKSSNISESKKKKILKEGFIFWGSYKVIFTVE